MTCRLRTNSFGRWICAACLLVSPFGRAQAQSPFQQYEAAKNAGRYPEAERIAAGQLRGAIAQRQESRIATWSTNLGNVYQRQGRYADAAALHEGALAYYERTRGPNSLDAALSLGNLAIDYREQGRYTESEQLQRRALNIRERTLGPNHPDVAKSLTNLGLDCDAQGRYTEAESFYTRAIAIKESSLGPEHPELARTINGLANVHWKQSRYTEAASLHKRAMAINEKWLGTGHPSVADNLNNLGLVYWNQGRYAEAEPLYKRAITIKERTLGATHPGVAQSLNNLALVYSDQGRYAEAEHLYKRAITILERAVGSEHEDLAQVLNNLALVYTQRHEYAEAEPLLKQALAVRVKALGPDHPSVGQGLLNLAGMYRDQGKYAEAEPLIAEALAIYEKAVGAGHDAVAAASFVKAQVQQSLRQPQAAWRSIDRSIAIAEQSAMGPNKRYVYYAFRAALAWSDGRRDQAQADLRKAIDFADEQRGRISGAERERAAAFASFAGGYEQMVAWDVELGNPADAFVTIERSHARSLLDEIETAGADLAAGRPAAETQRLARIESELKSRVANLEWQLSRIDPKSEADKAKTLETELAQARYALYAHERDVRNNSPIYRQLITRQAKPPALDVAQQKILAASDLLLLYLVGEEGGYVLSITRDRVRLQPLALEPDAASALGVTPGPLTAQRLFDALIGKSGAGVMQNISDPRSPAPTAKLLTLWRVLVPEPERDALTTGKVKRLIIVPDGPLALLPFEALVVGGDQDARFLLDDGPPIAYAPSAAVLMNLIERPVVPSPPDREPVLALGDPAYPGNNPGHDEAAQSGLLTSRSRYAIAGGKLPRLPHSAQEAQWVAANFSAAGIKAGVLDGVNATEHAVRYWAPGRKVLHMACHGLADASYGNYFGSLALTPGPQIRTDDDGFLTLAEICELKLKGCELAILSACQTNYGPQQKGEGTWALSRGFLVAGARRVVASNWLVDDEAAASLVSRFCGGLAQAEKAGKKVDYAAALQEAKRWVRKQEKWRSPYYWASLVLVGPP
jgi:CHAT domain-containing protein/tetratricopeptide (TPR) repeat protein